MSGSHEMSRRDFIKVTTGIVGGVIGAAIGLPTIFYLIDPALQEGGKDIWVSIGKFEDMQVGVPYPFSFTRVQVNGWERTSNSFGGFAVRKSDKYEDLVILNSRCTHLSCTVNWNAEGRVFLCPCHDASFGIEGEVLDGPPPRPLDRFTDFRMTEDGQIEILSKAG